MFSVANHPLVKSLVDLADEHLPEEAFDLHAGRYHVYLGDEAPEGVMGLAPTVGPIWMVWRQYAASQGQSGDIRQVVGANLARSLQEQFHLEPDEFDALRDSVSADSLDGLMQMTTDVGALFSEWREGGLDAIDRERVGRVAEAIGRGREHAQRLAPALRKVSETVAEQIERRRPHAIESAVEPEPEFAVAVERAESIEPPARIDPRRVRPLRDDQPRPDRAPGRATDRRDDARPDSVVERRETRPRRGTDARNEWVEDRAVDRDSRETREDADRDEREERQAIMEEIEFMSVLGRRLDDPRAAALVAMKYAHEHLDPRDQVDLFAAVVEEAGPEHAGVRNVAYMLLIDALRESGERGPARDTVFRMIMDNLDRMH